MKKLIPPIFISIFFLTACNNSQHYDIKSNSNYEKGKASLEEIEKRNPEKFLKVTSGSKKNILGQTVIKGNIFNNAKIVHYKDVELKLFFYSQTGTLLEEDTETVYETINPGGSTSFKSKYFAPKSTDSISIKIISAKF